MAEAKNGNPMMDFVCGMLKKDKDVPFKEVRDAGTKKGFKIFPIVYGRAKALLGLVPTAPRGQGKAAVATKAKAKAKAASNKAASNQGVVRRGPGRPPKAASAAAPARRGPGRPRKEISALDGLESLISAMKQTDATRDRYRKALEQVLGIIQGAL